MIVVVGLPAYREAGGESGVAGAAAEAAAEARNAGCVVELAGKIGDDAAGDAVVLALGRLGIGHAALLRDATRPTPLVVADEAEAEGAAAGEDGDPEVGADAAEATSRLLPADPAERPGLDAADVALALQYLPGASVVVLAEPLPVEAAAAAAEGAAFSGAQLVVVAAAGWSLAGMPAEATVLEAPEVDDGSFARLVGAFAARLDQGMTPAAAFSDAVRSAGWEETEGDEEMPG